MRLNERREGWRVLYEEATRGSPLAAQITELRARIADVVMQVLADSDYGRRHDEPTLEGMAHAFVGAGESLANWWLSRPGMSQDDVVDMLVGFVR